MVPPPFYNFFFSDRVTLETLFYHFFGAVLYENLDKILSKKINYARNYGAERDNYARCGEHKISKTITPSWLKF